MEELLKLDGYQIIGRDTIVKMKKSICGDMMGLGKTIEAITATDIAPDLNNCAIIEFDSWNKTSPQILQLEKDNIFNEPILIVCPASLKYNWQEEIHKWTNKKAVMLTKETFAYIEPIFNSKMGTYFIINYESLHLMTLSINDEDKNWWVNDIIWNKNAAKFKWLVFDESQRLNTFETRQFKLSLSLKLVCNPQYITCLTGTIITNKLSDLVPQLYIIDRLKYFLSPKEFTKDLVSLEANFVNRWQNNLEGLGKLLRKICYFRRELDSVNLPELTLQILLVDLDAQSKKEYDLAKNDLKTFLFEVKNKTAHEVYKSMRAEVVVKTLHLREIAAKGKIKGVQDFIRVANENDEKTVTFGITRDVTTKLIETLNCPAIIGQLSAEQKQKNKNEFQNNPDVMNIVISKAGSVGLTLTASRYILFIQQWFNPSLNDQIIARIHRRGANKPCFALHFLAKDTIDEKLWLRNEDKRKLTKDVNLTTTETEWSVFDKIYSDEKLTDSEFDMFTDILEKML